MHIIYWLILLNVVVVGQDMERTCVVAVCTRDRPQFLGRCLHSLTALQHGEGVTLRLLVVDNSASPMPSQRVVDLAADGLAPLSPVLVHEPRVGIPFARNRAFDFADEIGAESVIFLDDDQTAAPNLALTLCRVQEEEKCDAVKCEVRWEFEAPQRFKEFFYRPPATPEPLRWPYSSFLVPTNGVLIGRRLWDDLGLRFNEEFPLTGGTDVDFFARAWDYGVKIIHTSETFATEFCDAAKQRMSWLLRRSFRVGNTEAAMRLKGRGRIYYFAKGLLWIPWYGLLAARNLPAPNTSLHYFLKSVKGAGLMAGSIGIGVNEYRHIIGR